MTHPLPDFRDPSPAAMEVSSALELQPHPEGGATVSFGGMPLPTAAGRRKLDPFSLRRASSPWPPFSLRPIF